MIKLKQVLRFLPVYIILLIVLIGGSLYASNTVTTIAENAQISNRTTIIIDAGHGGVDGGATSCTGILESNINLDISLRLNDVFHLLGYKTVMIRTQDISVYTEGQTIAAKKVSDLKERLRIINYTSNAVLISIHQNYYPNSKYSGAQVFYAETDRSRDLAKKMQQSLIKYLNPNNNRQAKKADGIYLMQHVKCPSILIECGFISNPAEEALLRDDAYQKKLCSVIGCAFSTYYNAEMVQS